MSLMRLCLGACLGYTASAHPWAQFGASPFHASRGIAAGPSGVPVVKWYVPPPPDVPSASATIFSTVAISTSGALYTTAYDGCTTSYDAASGAFRWSHCLSDTTSYILSTPALSADGASVYIAACTNQSVSALSTADGSVAWSFPAQNCFRGSPVVSAADGTIIAGSTDNFVYALNPASGSLVWNYSTGNAIASTPALGPRAAGLVTAYVASTSGALTALDAAAGTLLWSTPAWGVGDPLHFHFGLQSSPSLSDDGTRVYIGTWDGALLCFDASSGTILWRFNASTAMAIPAPMILTTPSISPDGKLVYGGTAFDGGPMSAEFGTLFAVNAATGTLAWATLVSCDIITAPIVGAGGILYVGVDSGDGLGSGGIAAYDGNNGAVLWSKPLSEAVFASPSMGADGTLYIGGTAGELFALSPPSPGPTALPSATASLAPPPPALALLSTGAVVALAVCGGGALAIAALVAVRALTRYAAAADARSTSAGGFEKVEYAALSG